MTVTVADTMRWLHEEGLVRLAGVAARLSQPVAAYTIDINDGTVTVHPTTGVGSGSDVMTLPADDLPFPIGTRRRLVIVGVTPAEAMLVVDLASAHTLSLTGTRAQAVVRSWILQLLLNTEVTLTTNSPALAVAVDTRCRVAFIPGAPAVTLAIDDHRPPPTTLSIGVDDDLPDRIEAAADGTGAVYLGARYWPLRLVHHINDDTWADVSRQLHLEPGNDTATPTTGS